jgi:LacI family transcriptional regulator
MSSLNRLPTIADVAHKAGVSIATVSRVINASSPVTPGTALRVRAAIEELNYVPSSAARILAGRKTRTFGLVLPELSGAFFQPLLRGIEAGMRQSGYDLLISTTCSSREEKRPLGEHNTDGILVFAGSFEEEELIRLWTIRFPIVLLHQSPPSHTAFPMITIENQSGTRGIIDHLIEVHHRHKIAFLQGPEHYEDSQWREVGYRQALEQHGIPFDEGLVARGGFDEAEAGLVMDHWLKAGLEMDAVFCGNDDAAIGVLASLQRAGKDVPQEVAVVGFDDIPVARFLTPPLTTVRAPIELIGYTAVMMLARLVQGEPVDSPVFLPVELVIRQSCGCNLEN